MRLGSLKGKVYADYTTLDGSARAGIKYRQTSGRLVFEEGEHSKLITVDLIDDDVWSPTLEFKVLLSEPVNCEIGTNLYLARVKVIDDDCFPSNKYRNLIGQGQNLDEGLGQIPASSLLWSYMKWNWNAPGINWRSAMYVTFDQVHNAYLYFKMWVTVFLVDTLFNEDTPKNNLFMGSRTATCSLLAMGYVIPIFFIHLWDNIKTNMDVGGMTCELLQDSLFRKYLNYSEESRLAVHHCDIHVAIMDESDKAAKGYVKMLDVVRTVSKFLILMYFILQENPRAVVFVVSMPLLMIVLACLFEGGLSEAEEEFTRREASLISLIQEVCFKYRLIADYAQRPKMNEFFETRGKLFRSAGAKVTCIKNNLNFIPVYIGTIFTGLYIVMTCKYVGETLTVGAFVATVSIIGEIADDCLGLYGKLTSMKESTDAVISLARLFNFPTDLEVCKAIKNYSMARTLRVREEIFKGTSSHNNDENAGFKTDTIPLEITKMSYVYPASDDNLVLRDVSISVKQGNLVAVVGPHCSGKATLLKLLGQCIFPTQGIIYVPTHLRVLHVSQEPVLLALSALQNLTFGGVNSRDMNPARIRKILKRLDMKFLESAVETDLQLWERRNTREATQDSSVLTLDSDEELNGEGEDEIDEISSGTTITTHRSRSEGVIEEADGGKVWFEKLTHTEMFKVHLARALIMNPEVIVYHRPLSHFSTEKSKLMLGALREHVDNRGLVLPGESRYRRRPRTAFFVPENVDQAKVADVLWQVNGGLSGSYVYEISHDQLTRDFHPCGNAQEAADSINLQQMSLYTDCQLQC